MDRRTNSGGLEGNTLGKYRLLAELGRGGMAEVYLAVAHGPAGFNKLAVLKQITPTLAEDPEFLAMFLDEARLAARLSHPNVVQTNEVGHDGNRYYIAMEYLEGQPLNRILHRLGREGGLGLGMHLRILVDALSGLHHAHELADYDGTPLRVVHRDATPHNIFLTYDGQVKVVDFGIAKALNSSAETRTGVLKGKVAYMAPEQARGDLVDRRADIFSVGVMMWEALVRRRLWKGMTDVAILHHIVTGDVPRPGEVRAGVPASLEAVCLRALAVDQNVRYATAADFQASLEAAIDDLGERGNVREAGRIIANHFAEERERIRAIIEAQLSTAANMPSAEYRAVSLPLLLEPSPTVAGHDDSDRQNTLTPSVNMITPGTRGTPSSSAKFSTPLGLSSSTVPDPPVSHGPRRGLLAAGLVGGALLASAGLWVATRGSGPGVSGASTAPSGAPVASVVSTVPKQVTVKISASPTETALFLDGKPLAGNPFAATLAGDDRPHELRAEAPGYETRTRELRLDRDVELDLVLDFDRTAKDPNGGKRTSATAKVPLAPVPTVDDGLKTTPKPKRAIDPNNPYGQAP